MKSPRQWSSEEEDYIINNYKIKTNKEMSAKLNRTKTAIDLKIKRMGLKKSKYHYNQDYFEKIDTTEKAYWLGFIYADGCVSWNKKNNSCELAIKLQARDSKHLKKFNKALDGNVEVDYANRMCNLNGKFYEECIIRFYSKKMVFDLIDKGVIPNKTYHMKFPEVSEPLISHFIRGFFDGDGCICKNKNNNGKQYVRADFTCLNLSFIEWLRSVLYKNNICSYICKEKDKPYRLVIGGMKNTDIFLKYIYKDADVFLERKYKKKEDLYKSLNIEQRLLRQSEMTGFLLSEKENGKAEMPIRMEG